MPKPRDLEEEAGLSDDSPDVSVNLPLDTDDNDDLKADCQRGFVGRNARRERSTGKVA